MNEENIEQPSPRRRTPKSSSVKPRVKSAAVEIATSSLTVMSQEKEQFKDQTIALRKELDASLKTIEELNQLSGVNNEFVMSLPSGDITFTMENVRVDNCEVWAGNSRQYESLTLDKVKDIFPSIKDTGVKDPVLGRSNPNGQGLNQVVDGSRRLFAAGKAD